jgi:hypothetical protein
MPKETWPDRNHVRVTSDDGRRSYLYETDGCSRHCVEIADHHPDGTTRAYEVDMSLVSGLFHDCKGKEKK